jgi:cation transport regulator ChaB
MDPKPKHWRKERLMPKTTKSGKPKQEELPSTIKRSDPKAQRTFSKAHDSAVKQYGEGERAHRVALAALKNTHEKVGDRWEKKKKSGPSDEQAKGGVRTNRPTKGGVDAESSKEHLLDVAKRLQISGRSSMRKSELVEAIQKANDRQSAKARKSTKSSSSANGSKSAKSSKSGKGSSSAKARKPAKAKA